VGVVGGALSMRRALGLLCAAALALPAAAFAAAASAEAGAPCAHRDPQRRPFFGDLHVHTAFSQDASTQGVRNRPRDAYRFARGERIGINPYDPSEAGGEPLRSLRLARPLDFAAVTDHAELLGETRICRTPGLPGHDAWVCRIYRRFPRLAFFLMNGWTTRADPVRFGFCGPEGGLCLEAARSPWGEIRAAAEAATDRSAACRFTAFAGYEWTGAIETNNLHRNVIFANARVPDLPTSFYEASSAEALWEALAAECLDAGTGCDAVVIPHNSNLSSGLMFETRDAQGEPLDAVAARQRARLERLVEVMQHKGDSECALGGETVDELCAFEKLSFANFAQQYLPFLAGPPDPRSFVRRVLRDGLAEEERTGVNPFRFGLIASTDTHLGTPGAVSEAGYPGHGGAGAPAARTLPEGFPDDLEFNPGGLAGLWAEENSRAALFAAMKRREAFGTSGPRIAVRLFGGWELPRDACGSPGFAEAGYARGVPMGGTLPPRPPGAGAPRLAVSALRDPEGALLDRVQIVKGWVEDGETREVVHDVAGDPASSAVVDVTTCRTAGPGHDALCTVWEDPDFDPEERAFYYARVVQNPTCRWTAHVCRAHGVVCDGEAEVPRAFAACCDATVPKTTRERAWTSPVWYAPGAAP